jgi:hypothetical protein
VVGIVREPLVRYGARRDTPGNPPFGMIVALLKAPSAFSPDGCSMVM